jgi:hypothetical protein
MEAAGSRLQRISDLKCGAAEEYAHSVQFRFFSRRLFMNGLKKRGISLLLSTLCIGGTCTLTASAQYSSYVPQTWYQNGIMRQQTLNGWSARERARRERENQGRSSASRRPLAGGGSAVAGVSTFEPVAAYVLPEMLAKQQGSNEPERQALEKYYRVNLDYTEKYFLSKGRPKNDIAVALSSYLLLNYAVAVDAETLPLTEEQKTQFTNHLRETVKRDEKVQALGDRERQMMYEELILTPIALSDALGLAKKNNRPAVAEQVRKLARKNVEEFMGVPFENVRVTENGLEAN